VHRDEPDRRSKSAARKIDERCFARRFAFYIESNPPATKLALQTHPQSGWRRGASHLGEVIAGRKRKLPFKLSSKEKQIHPGLEKDRKD